MRLIKNLFYLGMLAVALGMGFERWKILTVVLLSPACYFADLPLWPVWLPLGLGCVAEFGYFLYLFVSRRTTWLLHHALVLCLLAGVILVRTWEILAEPPAVRWQGEDEGPPAIMLARAAGKLKRSLDERRSAGEPYPVDRSDIEELIRHNQRLPPSGFLGHGLPLPVRVVPISGADGPVLAPRPGDRPGTLYLAISEDGARYWITILGMNGYPCGEPGLLAGQDQAPIVLEPGDNDGGEE